MNAIQEWKLLAEEETNATAMLQQAHEHIAYWNAVLQRVSQRQAYLETIIADCESILAEAM